MDYSVPWDPEHLKKIKTVIAMKGKKEGRTFVTALSALLELLEPREFGGMSWKDRRKTQKYLLKLWEVILEALPDISFSYHSICMDVLFCIMRRKEFLMENLVNPKKKASRFSLFQDKSMKMGSQYTILLEKTILFSISVFLEKRYWKWSFLINFSARVLAVAFFRVSGIKELMTHACIEIPQDPEIEVGSMIDGVLKYVHSTEEEDPERTSFFEKLYRCRLFFDTFLGTSADEELRRMIKKSSPWMPKLVSDPSFIRTYHRELADQASTLCGGGDNVIWSLLPTYKIYAIKFSELFGKMKPEMFTETVLPETFYIFQNPHMINPMTMMLFSRSNLFDVDTTIRAMDVVDTWFQVMDEFHVHIQPTFDLKSFEALLDDIIDSMHFELIIRCLILVYHSLECFDGRPRLLFFSEWILRKHFFHFFLHWCRDVRLCYQRICVFKAERLVANGAHVASSSLPNFDHLVRKGEAKPSSGLDDISRSMSTDGISRIRAKDRTSQDLKDLDTRASGMRCSHEDGERFPQKSAVDGVLKSMYEELLGEVVNEQDGKGTGAVPEDKRVYVKLAMNDLEDVKKEFEEWKSRIGDAKEAAYPKLQFPRTTMQDGEDA
eukprot:TRINITY_DN2591_c0_g1_i1.p1 TRINITY_DN2591_c0_g1~~TRINITY_DN2591_c0_g1_i1.p1  ORF type:complete len:607 (-),score=170.27 TRINITY_DN2591_c0_g1_i1:67-1887(-)